MIDCRYQGYVNIEKFSFKFIGFQFMTRVELELSFYLSYNCNRYAFILKNNMTNTGIVIINEKLEWS